MSNFPCNDSIVQSQLKSKGHGKLSIHFAADQETIETIFRMIVSTNQVSLYGAVAEMCEVYESFHERTVRPVVMGNLSCSVRSREKFLWIVMTQQIEIFFSNNLKDELRSRHNKIS